MTTGTLKCRYCGHTEWDEPVGRIAMDQHSCAVRDELRAIRACLAELVTSVQLVADGAAYPGKQLDAARAALRRLL